MNLATVKISDLLAEPEITRFTRIQDRFERARAGGRRDIVLFGCGYLGKTALRALRAIGITPVAFADNNPALAGTELEGLPVLAPADAAARYRTSAVFVITVFTNGPVLRQLATLDVSVFTFAELAWCFPDKLLPYGSLERPSFFVRNASRIEEAHALWADEASRMEFAAQIAWRTTLDRSVLPPDLPHDEIYFPENLVKVGAEDVFVDCGSFDGDTFRALLERVPGGVKHFYGVEPDSRNAAAFRASLAALPSEVAATCTILPCALGNQDDTLNFVVTGTAGSHLGDLGTTEVPVRRLDDLLAGVVPTYLKMDIEGAERSALEGAVEVIRKHRPVLAICLYHKAEDLWDLPLLVRDLVPDYRLYLRRYCDECWEQVLYAIPAHRLV